MKSIRIGNDIRIEWPIVLSGDVSKLQDLDLTVEVRPSAKIIDTHNYADEIRNNDNKRLLFEKHETTVMMNGGLECRRDIGDGKEHCRPRPPRPCPPRPIPPAPVKLPYHIEDNTLIAMWTADRQFATGDYDIILYAHKNEGGQAVCDQYRFVRLVSHTAQADAPDDSGIEAVIAMQPVTLELSGLSAYEVAVINGFQGTEEEWLASLKKPAEDAAEQAKKDLEQFKTETKAEVKQDITNLNANTGVDDYPVFSESTAYSAGDVVNYQGKLYQFTADHAAGAWTGTDVEETDAVKAHIVQGLEENSSRNIVSQATILNISNSFFHENIFFPFSDEEILGDEVGDIIEHCLPFTYSKLQDLKSSEEGSVTYGFRTYVYKNTHESSTLLYVYAHFYNGATTGYMRCGLYDENDNLIVSSYQDGRMLFIVPKNYTLVISGDNSGFKVTPHLLTKPEVASRSIADYISNCILNYSDKKLIFGNKITVKTSNNNVDITKQEQNNFDYKLEWDNNTTSYLYIAAIDTPLTPLSKYYFEVTNNGIDDIEVELALTDKEKIDWSSGLLIGKKVVIPASETIKDTLLISGIKGIEDLSKTSVLVIIYGRDDLPRTQNGSLTIKLSYVERPINVDNAEHTINAEYAVNAGWEIGGLAENAVFRDEGPSGFTPNAMTVTQVDERTVRLTTNISESVVGSRYRGIYWKVNYRNFNDIKGIWKLVNQYSGYTTNRIMPAISDWGNNVDIIIIDAPKGNNNVTEYDLYSKIEEYKSLHSSDGLWTGALETQGYFYIMFERHTPNGLCNKFDDVLTLDLIPEKSRVIATEFTDEAEQRIKEIAGVDASKIQVTCWGDSLTAGAGNNNHENQATVLNAIKAKGYPDLSLTESNNITYPIMLQALLGDKYNVTNCGVGGENINTIAARLGACIAYAKNDFTLPSDTTPVQIGAYDGKLSSSWGDNVAPLLQGHGNSVNPCYIQGIECTLKWTGTNGSDVNGTYTIERISAGDKAISFSAKTPIIMSGSKLYRNTELAVIWCWQNGGFTDTNALIEKLDKIIAHVSTDKYILIGLHSGTASSRNEQEEALTSKYGDKYFNWREYVSTNAMYDFGLTPNEDDLTAMEQGSCPPSLLIDSVHLKAAGYAILGFKIVERYKNLGYIE